MKSFRSHFVFNKSQRNGIFILVLIIVILQTGYFLIDFSSGDAFKPEQQEQLVRFQKEIDSLKRKAALTDSATITPFNPNFLSDYKGYTIGLTVEEIDRLHSFREQDKWINTSNDFQKVTGVSDSTLKRISPYFKFPEWVQKPRSVSGAVKSSGEKVVKQDLNTATAEALRQVSGVGEVLSQRILNYRKKLGGFQDEVQLYDVYGLRSDVVERIALRFSVSEPAVEKKNINDVSLIDLSETPYLTYELAREVIRYRDSREKIISFEELLELRGFSEDKIDRIKLYLTVH